LSVILHEYLGSVTESVRACRFFHESNVDKLALPTRGREVGTVTIRTVAIRVSERGWASAIQLPTQTFRAADKDHGPSDG